MKDRKKKRAELKVQKELKREGKSKRKYQRKFIKLLSPSISPSDLQYFEAVLESGPEMPLIFENRSFTSSLKGYFYPS